MKMFAAIAVLAAAASAFPTSVSSAVPVRKAPHRAPSKPPAWTETVVATPEGGYRVGNPAARAKLVEFGSISCPTCRAFHLESIAAVRARVATGGLSYEFRPFAVHSIDPMLHALMLCAGPRHYVAFADDFYADQPALMARYETWAEADPKTNPDGSPATRIALAREWGLTAFAMRHGLTAAGVTRCLSNTAAFAAQQRREDAAARDFQVTGTPTFVLNGRTLKDVLTWPEIETAVVALD